MYCFHSLEIASITKIFTVKKKNAKKFKFQQRYSPSVYQYKAIMTPHLSCI